MKPQLLYALMKNALAPVLLTVTLTAVVQANPLKKEEIVLDATPELQAPLTVSGKVTDEASEEMPGVNILEKGTTNGTSTDVNGRFTLQVRDANSVLVFSFIGYKPMEITVGAQADMSVSLVPDISSLEEVVVVGYGIQQKASLTGAVSDVGGQTLNAVAVGDATQRLQGRVAGVTVTGNNAPGSTSTVRVRGYGSLGNNNPLYIIDGIPRTDMDNINPNDIESVTVLKDASSSAIYGSRAANGVIVVTTKSGKEGATKLTFDTRIGVQQKINRPDLMNSEEIGLNLWQKYKNMGLTPGGSGWGDVQYGTGAQPVLPDYILPAGKKDGEVDESTYAYPNPYNAITRANKGDTDWYEAVFAPAPIQEYNLSLSGGNNGSNYAVSAGYLNQLGIVNYEGDAINPKTKNGYTRYSLRSNADIKVNDWLKIGPRLSATFGDLQGTVDPGIVNGTLTIHPIIPIYDIRGNFAGSKSPATGNGTNQVASLIRNKDDYTHSLILQGSLYAQATIMKSLYLKSTLGVSYNTANSVDRTLMNPEFNQAQLIDRLQRDASFQYQYNWTNTLNYVKSFGAHNFNALVGTEAIDRRAETLMAGRSTYAFTDLDFMVINAGERDVINAGTFDQVKLFSYFGRLNYDFKGKYLFEAVVRRDGSSRFIGDYRWGTFPAFSAGWRIKDEGFMDGISWIDDLKLRAGWGTNGNDNVGNYNAYNTYIAHGQESYYNIAGASRSGAVAGVHKSFYGNPAGRWETNVATNVGIDASFFNSKLDVTVDLYNRRTTDMLYPDQRPGTWGQINMPSINIGEMKNNGIDLALGYRGEVSDFKYSVTTNFTHFRNEVVKLNNNPNEVRFSNPIEANFNTITTAGMPLNTFYGYQLDGIFNTAEEVAAHPKAFPNVAGVDTYSRPGVFKFRDVNGDGVINTGDRTFIGNGYPDLSYGINIDLKYKNFDFNTFLQGVAGRQIINNAKRVMLFIRNDGNYLRERLYQSWTPERYANGDKITLPITINNDANMQLPSSFFVEDGDYLRMKNIQLGYTLPASVLSKMKLKGLRVYVQATNVFTITKYSGLDVEVNETGIGDTVYPTARVIMGGLNFDF
jgi:TonB-dependent starch-binding outer membrane protein SusC